MAELKVRDYLASSQPECMELLRIPECQGWKGLREALAQTPVLRGFAMVSIAMVGAGGMRET